MAQPVLHLAADARLSRRSQRDARSGELARSAAVSLREFGAGFGAAIVVGLTLGVLAGWFRTVEYTLDPFIWFVYSAPLIAFYPLFVLWLGLGTHTVIAIAFLLSVTPIAVNTINGIRSSARRCCWRRDRSARARTTCCGRWRCRRRCR